MIGPKLVQCERKIAFVLGGAACVWDDLEGARTLCTPDIVCCVNDIGVDYSGRIDHWVSFHSELLTRLILKRKKRGYADAANLWTGKARHRDAPKGIKTHGTRGGSSGMLATGIMCDRVHATHIILCGVPIDGGMPHYHNRDNKNPWIDARYYHKHWRDNLDAFRKRVRSMSGWTSELLGRPDEEWLQRSNK